LQSEQLVLGVATAQHVQALAALDLTFSAQVDTNSGAYAIEKSCQSITPARRRRLVALNAQFEQFLVEPGMGVGRIRRLRT
jgi:flagellar biogenesis protein FliO